MLTLKYLANLFCLHMCFRANSEIFLLILLNKDLLTLPQFYNELFSAWYAIENFYLMKKKMTCILVVK